MKRLVRQKNTHKYLTLEGRWTEDLNLARHFEDMRSVVLAMQQHDLQDIELVLLMEDEPGAYDVVIPLGRVRPLNLDGDQQPPSGETNQGKQEEE